MARRRDVVKGLALLAGAGGLASGLTAEAAGGPLYRVIADDRFPGSDALARALGKGSAPLARISGDVTGLWFHDLAPRWRLGPAAIAGVTGEDALFVLERLGWDAGLRVSARAPAGRSSLAVAWLMTPARRG